MPENTCKLKHASRRFYSLVLFDHIYNATFIAQLQTHLLAGNYPSILFVDPHIHQIIDLNDTIKVFHQEGKLQELGKISTYYNALYIGWFTLDFQMLDIGGTLAKIWGF